MSAKKLSREAIARIEIGSTDISRRLSFFLMLVFILAIFSVPVAQYFLDWGKPAIVLENIYSATATGMIESIDQRNKHILKNIDILETELEERSFLRKLFLPHCNISKPDFYNREMRKSLWGRMGSFSIDHRWNTFSVSHFWKNNSSFSGVSHMRYGKRSCAGSSRSYYRIQGPAR